MIDRSKQPKYKEITKLEYLGYSKYKLDNDIPVYLINAGSEDILKIEFIFEAGIWYQNKTFTASFTNSLLNTGTKDYTEQQIAEITDYYGAFISLQSDRDFASVTLIVLKKYFEKILPLLRSIITSATFPEGI